MPIPFLAGFSILKFLKGLLTPKNLLYIVGAAALAFVLYKGYMFIYNRGADHERQEIAKQVKKLTGERDEAVSQYKAYKAQYDNWMTNSKLAKEQFIREQAQTIAGLEADLRASEKRANQKQVVIREIPKYIPAQVDDAVVLPFGFVRLYAETLQGAAATDAGLGTISFGPQGNAGSPSGFTLSQFAEIAADNNVQCVRYREGLIRWQTWYTNSKDQYDRAIKIQSDTAPKDMPPPPAPPTAEAGSPTAEDAGPTVPLATTS